MIPSDSRCYAVVEPNVSPRRFHRAARPVNVTVAVNLIQDLEIAEGDVVAGVVPAAKLVGESALVPADDSGVMLSELDAARVSEACRSVAGSPDPGRRES